MKLHHFLFVLSLLVLPVRAADLATASLRAGAAKVDITNPAARTPDDNLYVKALVLSDGSTNAVLITIDAVAIAEIGTIKNDFLAKIRGQLQQQLHVKPANVLVNTSHCHGIVCNDVAERTLQAVRQAWQNMVPVRVGAGSGHEDRIMENRRLTLKNGRQADNRRAYALPPDKEVAGVGPVDPQIGILRLDRENGQTLAVVYNFACHPIQGTPGSIHSADLTGFASQVVEDNLSEGAVALFLQGCAGDINPVVYKDFGRPRDAERLGNMLGLSTLKAVRKIQCHDAAKLQVVSETVELPRADFTARIASLRAEQTRLVESLRGTSLNLKTFLPLYVKYRVSGEFPSSDSHTYLHDRMLGRDDWLKLDAENRRNMEQYISNIHAMEELTRVQENLSLLRMHQAQNAAAGKKTLTAELLGLRVGDFVLVTFPGELTVQIGLNIKKRSPHEKTFVAGYTNGYIYYAPTDEQLRNSGWAQEDCDCLLAPGWQMLFENKAAEILGKL
jgi:hypothetical protein